MSTSHRALFSLFFSSSFKESCIRPVLMGCYQRSLQNTFDDLRRMTSMGHPWFLADIVLRDLHWAYSWVEHPFGSCFEKITEKVVNDVPLRHESPQSHWIVEGIPRQTSVSVHKRETLVTDVMCNIFLHPNILSVHGRDGLVDLFRSQAALW